ncbi:hypothetical protein BRADI_1g46083v3 [Brachypodium distachyon]|uniref:Uncharacterized protein n=1 Tax=Brachypodium distachyon TaxID=15368 RepID=A0A0Q3H7N4_BRADI|nr:hypothetical protein BRADI_1g46083v3 [Brachypodium distachyon]
MKGLKRRDCCPNKQKPISTQESKEHVFPAAQKPRVALKEAKPIKNNKKQRRRLRSRSQQRADLGEKLTSDILFWEVRNLHARGPFKPRLRYGLNSLDDSRHRSGSG